jgi:hypothetical protein
MVTLNTTLASKIPTLYHFDMARKSLYRLARTFLPAPDLLLLNFVLTQLSNRGLDIVHYDVWRCAPQAARPSGLSFLGSSASGSPYHIKVSLSFPKMINDFWFSFLTQQYSFVSAGYQDIRNIS